MKKIEAILTPHRLEAVKELLLQRGCQEVIVSDVLTDGGPNLHYRGLPYTGHAHRVKVETIVVDSEAMPTAEAILHGQPEGAAKDERVMVHPIEEVISIGIWKVDPQQPAGPRAAGARVYTPSTRLQHSVNPH